MNKDDILNMPAGREMDALIARNIIGLEESHEPGWWWINGMMEECPDYSTDIAAAWEVVEFLLNSGYAPNLVNDDNGKWYLSFNGTQDLDTVTFVTAFTDVPELWCESAPLAICRAALLAEVE